MRENLEEIVVQVRSKDVPLEKCLDLFDEALKIGRRCIDLIDRTDLAAATTTGQDDADSRAEAPSGPQERASTPATEARPPEPHTSNQ
jgi:exonuclease VII small subunit